MRPGALALLLGAGLLAPYTGWRLGTLDEPVAGSAPASITADSSDTLTGAAVDLVRFSRTRTPFRPTHRPPGLRYGQEPAPPPPPPPAAPPRPALILSGVVWGQRPLAILEGIPGREGAVSAEAGDTAGPIRVLRIEPGKVVVSGLDTTWVLTVREPW